MTIEDEILLGDLYKTISAEELSAFCEKYSQYGAYDISIYHSSVTLMMYTKEQVRSFVGTQLFNDAEESFYEIVKRHNDNGCVQRSWIKLRCDSKEHLDTQYNGNWYYYYK